MSHEGAFQHFITEMNADSYHGLCAMAETHVAWHVLRLKFGDAVGIQRQTMQVGTIALNTVRIATLPSSMVIGGEGEMRGMIVLPMDMSLFCRALAMDDLPVSLQKTKRYVERVPSDPVASIATRLEDLMQSLSMTFDDVTNALVQEVYAGE